MKPFTLALRAVGAQLALRVYVPVLISAAVAVALFVALGLWLTTLSQWWWLLFIPLTVLLCVILAVAGVFWLLIRFVRPVQTKAQKQAVSQFVDRLQDIIDVAGTPKLLILFRVIRSIAAPSKSSYLSNLIQNRKLANEFRDLQRLFDTRSMVK